MLKEAWISARTAGAAGRTPRVHGNGFIQIDLSDRDRLHVWGHPDIPRQSVYTPLHDHRFGFESKILRGVLQNDVYEFVDSPDGNFEVFAATNEMGSQNTQLEATNQFGYMRIVSMRTFSVGKRYKMEPGEVHISTPLGIVVSIITKDGPTLSQGGPSPRVFVQRGTLPDNWFKRDSFSPALLWAIIREALNA